jgi:hypothetical protein
MVDIRLPLHSTAQSLYTRLTVILQSLFSETDDRIYPDHHPVRGRATLVEDDRAGGGGQVLGRARVLG